jgi:hypothetical protein
LAKDFGVALSAAAIDDLVPVLLAQPTFKSSFLTTIVATTAKNASCTIDNVLFSCFVIGCFVFRACWKTFIIDFRFD